MTTIIAASHPIRMRDAATTAWTRLSSWLQAQATNSRPARRTRHAQLLMRLTDSDLARIGLERSQIMPHVFGAFYTR